MSARLARHACGICCNKNLNGGGEKERKRKRERDSRVFNRGHERCMSNSRGTIHVMSVHKTEDLINLEY